MRKNVLFFIAFFIALSSATAQPTITGANMPAIGDILNIQYTQSDFVFLPSYGPAINWDYSNLVKDDQGGLEVDTFISPLATPYASLFPGANIAYTSSDGFYGYYNSGAAGFKLVGSLDDVGGDTIRFDPFFNFYNAPFTYGSTFGQVVTTKVYSNGSYSSELFIDSAWGVGYGTLKLPEGKFYNNVLQVKSTQYYIINNDTFPTTDIFFFSADVKWPLLTIELNNDGSVFSATYQTKPPVVTPLSWLGFTGKLANGQALLNWQTTNEHNVSHFIVQRSADGTKFSSLKQVQADTKMATQHQYSSVDAQPLVGKNYYRIQQIDKDGKSTFSKTIELQMGRTNSISIIPTMVAGPQLMLQTSFAAAQVGQLSIVSSHGKTVLSQSIMVPQGINSQTIFTNNLPAGVYFVSLISGTEKYTAKFVKE